jgi:hypothetical protein
MVVQRSVFVDGRGKGLESLLLLFCFAESVIVVLLQSASSKTLPLELFALSAPINFPLLELCFSSGHFTFPSIEAGDAPEQMHSHKLVLVLLAASLFQMLALTPKLESSASTLRSIQVNVVGIALATLDFDQVGLDCYLEGVNLEFDKLTPALVETHGLVEVYGVSGSHLDICMEFITI